MKAKRLGDPERPDEDEEDFLYIRRGGRRGAFYPGSGRFRGLRGGRDSRYERFPGAGDRDPPMWYEDPVKER